MRVFQLQVVVETGNDEDEDTIRERMDQILYGSGFAVAEVVRDYEQGDDEDGE